MPSFPCRHKLCPQLLPSPGYCDKHKTEEQEQKSAQYRRDNLVKQHSEFASFYWSRAWQRLRDQYIRSHPICEHCLVRPSEDCHHKEPLRQAWDKRLNWGNLMAVCTPCHGELDRIARLRG